MHIYFAKNEHDVQTDGGTKIPLGTIKTKLKPALRPLADDAAQLAAQTQALGLAEPILTRWLHLAYRKPKHVSASRQLRMIDALLDLKAQYGLEALAAAIIKTIQYDEPQKCTLAYLKTVLENDRAAPTETPATPPPAPPRIREGSMEDIWAAVLAPLRLRISASTFETWLRPTRLLNITDGVARIGVPDDLFNYQLTTYYHPLLIASLTTVTGHPITAIRCEVTD